MAQPLLDDALWACLEPLLPKPRRRARRRGGRPRVSERAALTGILFVLRGGLPWQMLPREMGCGSGSTCWRRVVESERAGGWRRLHETLLAEPRRRPDVLQGDRGYDSQPHRDRLAARGIVAIFGRRRTSHGSGLGVFRWVVERTLAWLHRFRRLAVRYERHDRVHHAFLTLGCALICWNYLKSTGRVF